MAFFATSHGKNACDGIGGTVKREAANAILRATTSGHILTPLQLYEWCSIHLNWDKVFLMSLKSRLRIVQFTRLKGL